MKILMVKFVFLHAKKSLEENIYMKELMEYVINHIQVAKLIIKKQTEF